MSPLGELNSFIDIVRKLLTIHQEKRDPFRGQAGRILKAFEAHDLSATQVARLVPEGLLPQSAVLANADALKTHLTSAFLHWVQDTLQLERAWIDGTSQSPHQLIFSYKHAIALHKWLDQKASLDHRFILYVFKQDAQPLGRSCQGRFVVVLEEAFAELDDESLYRYYYLTQGEHFERSIHNSCFEHLLQILAIAYHHKIFVKGAVLSPKDLQRLDDGHDLLPNLIRPTRGTYWYPDDALWPHMSRDDQELEEARHKLDHCLTQQGLAMIVTTLETQRAHYASRSQLDVTGVSS